MNAETAAVLFSGLLCVAETNVYISNKIRTFENVKNPRTFLFAISFKLSAEMWPTDSQGSQLRTSWSIYARDLKKGQEPKHHMT